VEPGGPLFALLKALVGLEGQFCTSRRDHFTPSSSAHHVEGLARDLDEVRTLAESLSASQLGVPQPLRQRLLTEIVPRLLDPLSDAEDTPTLHDRVRSRLRHTVSLLIELSWDIAMHLQTELVTLALLIDSSEFPDATKGFASPRRWSADMYN
jgi:hypothetical protein